MKVMRKASKGFTLIELLAVMAILGILMLLAIPKFSAVTDSANVKVFENNHRVLVGATQMFMAKNDGNYPTSNADVADFVGDGITANEKPDGASYVIDADSVTSQWTAKNGDVYKITYTFEDASTVKTYP